MPTAKFRLAALAAAAALIVTAAVEASNSDARFKRPEPVMKGCIVAFDSTGDVHLAHGESHIVNEGGGVKTNYYCLDGLVCYQTTDADGHEIDAHCYSSPGRIATPPGDVTRR